MGRCRDPSNRSCRRAPAGFAPSRFGRHPAKAGIRQVHRNSHRLPHWSRSVTAHRQEWCLVRCLGVMQPRGKGSPHDLMLPPFRASERTGSVRQNVLLRIRAAQEPAHRPTARQPSETFPSCTSYQGSQVIMIIVYQKLKSW